MNNSLPSDPHPTDVPETTKEDGICKTQITWIKM